MNIDYDNGKNKLIYGDNLKIMQGMRDNLVDLIYLDPPFNSNRNYNILYKDQTGRPVPEQAEAFCDIWSLDSSDEEEIKNIHKVLKKYSVDDSVISFFQNWFKSLKKNNNKLLAYLFYMMKRLFEMKRILKPTGSLYLHCDPTASHYIKIMLDMIFGYENFINEIVWLYQTGGSSKRHFSKKHDVILFYGINEKLRYFNPLKEKSYLSGKFGFKKTQHLLKEDKKGFYTMVNCRDYWKINSVGRSAKERLGYPTQKPKSLLKRIIEASSKEGDIVFDPFCGCGTSIYAAEDLKRKWIGCDVAVLSIRLIEQLLETGKEPLLKYRLKKGVDFEVCGYPTSLEGAKFLFEDDPKQFEHWAVEKVYGFPNSKKSRDKGIDGRIYFEREGRENGSMVLSVKGGENISPSMVRDLRGVLEREEAELAGMILMREPTKGMREEAAAAGQLEYKGQYYDKIQFLTVKELTEGKKTFNLPSSIVANKYIDNQQKLEIKG